MEKAGSERKTTVLLLLTIAMVRGSRNIKSNIMAHIWDVHRRKICAKPQSAMVYVPSVCSENSKQFKCIGYNTNSFLIPFFSDLK